MKNKKYKFTLYVPIPEFYQDVRSFMEEVDEDAMGALGFVFYDLPASNIIVWGASHK